jgi:molybdopterin synthase catalytic subunit
MKVHVRLWGGLTEVAGFAEDVLEIEDDATAGDVVSTLEARAPALARYRSHTRIAVNADVVSPEMPLADGDEVSLIPPVAGGASEDAIEIRKGPLDVSEAIAFVSTPASGGIGVFAGVVRETNDGNAVSEIDYTAFDEMALREMNAVVGDARERWELHRVWVAHSIGRLKVGDVSVVVAVSSTHRAEALEACRAIIDGVKERATIWKQEFGPDGTRWINLPEPAPTPPQAR